jgi:tRNA-guanine family transglycosylase
MKESRQLVTRRGVIKFPAYIPVTTFGQKYPLDNLIRPYLPRISPAVMVSHHYAREMKESFRLPVMVDSGGFAALFENAKVSSSQGLGIIKFEKDGKKEVVDPREVLKFQEEIADVAFTLDFPISPGLDLKESEKRHRLTVKNAFWALENKRRRDLPLYAVIQAWDKKSARKMAEQYKSAGFDGIAIGGLVPRARNFELVRDIVSAVRETIPEIPLHVFGLGKPEIVSKLFQLGVDSVDSSSYVKMAADGKIWGSEEKEKPDSITPINRIHLALCNLANATGTTLPLSASRLLFSV